MTEVTLVRHVSGDWNQALGQVRLRVAADNLNETRDLLFSPTDIQPLIVLLLVLSGKVGATPLPLPPPENREMVPLRPDFLGLGETDDGDIVLQLDIGQTSLAFSLPAHMGSELGHSLITLGASTKEPAN